MSSSAQRADPADYRRFSVFQLRRALVFGSLNKYQPAGSLWKQIILKTNVNCVIVVLKRKYSTGVICAMSTVDENRDRTSIAA